MDHTHTAAEKMQRINVLNLIGFLDLFGVSMIMPLIMPELAELGASPTLVGFAGSLYGGLQLFISPVYGKWSDEAGRQISLTICMIFVSLGYTIMGVYTAIPIFFVSRIILGCFKHSQTISKACLSDLIHNEPSRHSTLLGKFNSFSSVGFILGPIVGGHLAETSGGFPLVAMSAGALFMFNAGFVWWVIPPDKQDKSTKNSSSRNTSSHQETEISSSSKNKDLCLENRSILKFFGSFADLNWQELWDIMLFRFFSGLSMIVFRTNFAMTLKYTFSATPSVIGYMTSFSGIISGLSGFVMGPVMKRYKDDNAKLLFHATIFQVVSLLWLCIAPSYIFLLLALVPLNLVTSFSRVSSTTLTIEAVSSPPAQQSECKLSDSSRLEDFNTDKCKSHISPSRLEEFSTDKSEGYISASRSSSSTRQRTVVQCKPEEEKCKTSSRTASSIATPSPIAAVLGVGQSVMGVARMVAPIVIGLAQEVGGIDAPGYISVVFAVLAVGVMVLSGRAKLF